MQYHLSFVLLLGLLTAPVVFGQSRSSTPEPTAVRLVPLSEPSTLEVSAIGHFRARIAPSASRPVNYLWDLGDGTLSIGSLVSHAYSRPGDYEVTVIARNEAGSDTLRSRVKVVPKEPRVDTVVTSEAVTDVRPALTSDSVAPALSSLPSSAGVSRSALFGSGIAPERGGYTWVVASDLWGERAQTRLLSYRLRGLRSDVYVESEGAGSPVHRIVVGHFHTVEEALVARAWLPSDVKAAWLLDLGSFSGVTVERER